MRACSRAKYIYLSLLISKGLSSICRCLFNFIQKCINNIGLYRDDGLAIFKNTTGSQAFQRNLKSFDYLDITLNLTKDSSDHTENQTTSRFTSTQNLTTHPLSSNKYPQPSIAEYQPHYPTKKHHLVNPPCSENVHTNVAKTFLNLIKKHFPPNQNLHPVFKKNNVKVSYSCMPKMSSITDNHKKTFFNQTCSVCQSNLFSELVSSSGTPIKAFRYHFD